MRGDYFTTPSIAMGHADLIHSILDGLKQGRTHAQLARDLGSTVPTVSRIVKELADDARRLARERVAEAMMVQDHRLEWLYAYCAKRIAEAEAFDKEAVRLAILVCERQSKLLGLDKHVVPNTAAKRDWLTDMSEAELRKEAERLGIKIPERFGQPVPAS